MQLTIVDADPAVAAPTISRELREQQEKLKSSVSIMSLSEYDFLSMAYNGDGNFRDGSLIRPHERENAASYIARREMAFLKNFLKPVVNARIDPVFSTEIQRETQDESGQAASPPYWMAFQADCDNAGTLFKAFIEDAAREGNLQTLTFLVVDNVSTTNALVVDNIRDRKYPYIYKQNRDTVYDYSVDRYGKIQWIRFFDHTEKDPSGKALNYYRYWDKTESRLQQRKGEGKDAKWVDNEVVAHNLGVVPVYPMAFASPRKKDCLSIGYDFYDLARCNWTIFNLDSATMEAIFDQCFSLLCIQGEKQDDMTVGTKTVCWVEPEVSNMPAFVSPDPNVAQLASNYADKIKNEIYAIAEQNGVTATKGVLEQSGKAKEWDFQAHGFILKIIAGICRKAEIWVADIFMRYSGEKFIYIPHYKEDYAIRDSDVLIKVQESVLTDGFGPQAQALARKNIARVAFSHNAEDELKTVIDEIDAGVEDEIQSVINTEEAPNILPTA